MQTKILDFISALRDNNVRVSLSESQDALNAVLTSPDLILNQDIFKQTLKCTLIKDTANIDIFNFLFDIFFLQRHLKYSDFIKEVKEKELQTQRQALRLVVAKGDGDGDSQKDASETENLHELLKEAESEWSLHPLTKSLITGNAAHWENLVDEKVSLLMSRWAQKPLRRKTTYEKNILESFDWFEIDSGLDNIYYQAAINDMGVGDLIDRVEAHKKKFRKLIKQTVQYTEIERNTEGGPRERGWNRPRLTGSRAVYPACGAGHSGEDKLYAVQRLRAIPFEALSSQEIKSLSQYAQRIAQILATKVSRRQKLSKQQRIIDLRNTVRRSVSFGGIPVKLVYRKQKLKKHDVMLICDVSGSVIKPARFLLQFMYSLQQCMRGKIRSFIFVSRVDEITPFFQGREIKEAINLAMSNAEVDYYGRSDFGSAFFTFTEKYLASVNSKTIVIIIGDARNNRRPSQIKKLQQIRNKAKKIIWLNPESQSQWNTGDSIMNEYGKCAHEIHEVMNFETLTKFVERLML